MCEIKELERDEFADSMHEEERKMEEQIYKVSEETIVDGEWLENEIEEDVLSDEEEINEEKSEEEKAEVKEEKKPKRILLSHASLEVTAFACKDQSRYGLNGLHITDKYVEVTEGHILLRLYHEEVDSDEFPDTPGQYFQNGVDCVLPSEDVKKVVIPKKVGNLPILKNACLTQENGAILVSTTDLSIMQTNKIRPIEIEYPDTDQFLKEPEGGITFAVDAKLLKILTDYLNKVEKEKDVVKVVFNVVDPGSPIRFSFELSNGQRGEGALMPMRVG